MIKMYIQKGITIVGVLKFTGEKSRNRIRPRYGSEDPDPYQNVTDPEYGIASGVLVLYWHLL
jgi:hypothetical protein